MDDPTTWPEVAKMAVEGLILVGVLWVILR